MYPFILRLFSHWMTLLATLQHYFSHTRNENVRIVFPNWAVFINPLISIELSSLCCFLDRNNQLLSYHIVLRISLTSPVPHCPSVICVCNISNKVYGNKLCLLIRCAFWYVNLIKVRALCIHRRMSETTIIRRKYNIFKRCFFFQNEL